MKNLLWNGPCKLCMSQRIKGDRNMKRIIALLVALFMISLAFAMADLPSKTSEDIATVGKIVADGDENKEIKL